MLYRRLGACGLQVSAVSLGAWATIGERLDDDASARLMDAAYELGINCFDNAETYGDGRAETVMGRALAKLRWPRESFVISSKVYWGTGGDGPTARGLNRKHVLEACDAALRRLGVDHLDLYLCHRPDPATPIHETVRAMSDLVSNRGKALYWGTSEWPVDAIEEAHRVVERCGLVAPVTEQAQYNLLTRGRVEREYAPLYTGRGMGMMAWSPLAYGLLSGRYREGLGGDGRLARSGYEWLRDSVLGERCGERCDGRLGAVLALCEVASRHGFSPAQLSMAWVLSNGDVSTAITGASNVEQLRETVGAVELLDGFTRELRGELEDAFDATVVD